MNILELFESFLQTYTSFKLTPTYKGPFQITDINSQRINVRNLLTQKVRSVHPAHIHPFVVDTNQVNPTNVAKQASQEYVVETILKIDGDKMSRIKRLEAL